MRQLIRQNISRQKMSRQNISSQKMSRQFLKRNNFRLKKTGPGQIQTLDLCRPRCIRYLETKYAGGA